MATITVDPVNDSPNTLRFFASILQSVAQARDDGHAFDAEPAPQPGTIPESDDDSSTEAVAPPPPPAPVKTAGAEAPAVDSAGVPYDAATHSSSHATDKHGRWKYIRGLAPAVRSAAEARDSAIASSGTTSAVPPPPPAGFQSAVADVTPPPPPVAVPAASATGTVVAGSVPGGSPTFRTVMKKVTDALKEKKLSHDELGSALSTVGLEANQLASLAAMPDKVGDFDAYIDAMLIGR